MRREWQSGTKGEIAGANVFRVRQSSAAVGSPARDDPPAMPTSDNSKSRRLLGGGRWGRAALQRRMMLDGASAGYLRIRAHTRTCARLGS